MRVNRADVIVIGGGPAGGAMALALARRGPSVVLLERNSSHSRRVGEVLPPAVRPALAALGLWDRFLADEHLPSTGVTSWWGGDRIERDYFFGPYGDGWHICRRRFDEMLLMAARDAGVTIIRSAKVRHLQRESNSEWQLEAAIESDSTEILQGRFVVCATGRSSQFSAFCGPRQRVDRLVGIAQTFVRLADAPCLPRLWIEASVDGWSYTAPLPQGRLVAVFLTDGDLLHGSAAEFVQTRLRDAPHTSERLAGWTPECAPQVFPAEVSCPTSRAGHAFVTVGDAANAFDPASGRGIVKALESAVIAADAIVGQLAGRPEGLVDYNAMMERDFSENLQRRHEVYLSEKRWQHSLFWRRRHVAVDRL